MKALCCGGLLLAAVTVGGCDYARMTNDEAVHTYERALPAQPKGTVPVGGGGAERARSTPPQALRNPLAATPQTVKEGRRVYENFCIHCHGPDADGNGTVGQSFAPLPADLAGPRVRGLTDGDLFTRVSFGSARHPPLADTLAECDRWAVVAYLRSLPPRLSTASAR